MNAPWLILSVVVAFAGGAALGEWDGVRRADLRHAVQTQKTRADGLDQAVARYRHMETAYRANQLQTRRNAAAAVSADRAAVRLRADLATLRRVVSSLPAPACADSAATCYAVFGECSERYRSVARAADDHAADVRLCIDGGGQ